MSKKNKSGTEEVLQIKNVITFKEFLEWLPINSIQTNTWLSYNLLWYASRCLIYIREAKNWHNVPCVFSSRLARAAEYVVFSDIATQAWCPEHLKLFSCIQFNADTASVTMFQHQASQIGGFPLNHPDVSPFLNWEAETPDWPTLFSERIAHLYSMAHQASAQRSNDMVAQSPATPTSGNPFRTLDESTSPKTPQEIPAAADGAGSARRPSHSGDGSMTGGMNAELTGKCVSACELINDLANSIQKLSRYSNNVVKSVKSGFEVLQEAQYKPHGKLVKLLLDNWGYLPPTLQIATPRSIADVVTKSRDYNRFMKVGGEHDQIKAVEFMWNNYLIKAVQESGNFDEDAAKMKSVNVEELSKSVARKTLAESGIDSSLPSMIRKIGDELKLMNVQSISKGRPAGNSVNIPGSSVAQHAEEAKRLLAGKKKQEVKDEIKNNASAIARYCNMSEYEVFLLDYEEQQVAREIRKNNL